MNGDRASPRRRAASFALALAIEVLLLLAFFTLNFRDRKTPEFEGGRLTTFDVSAESETDRSASVQKEAEVVPQVRPPRPSPPIPKPKVELPPRPLQMIEVTREDFVAGDISKLGSAANGPSPGRQLASNGGGRRPGDSARVGTAPNGEPLYAAEWYREPTQAELSGYMAKRIPEGPGWGLIACKTAERYHVTDCVELGNSPGSRIAGGARQAAWQFLVRPPRIGGKPQIGEWVSIRITYNMEDEDQRSN